VRSGARRIPVGRVRGHRGTSGEITVIVAIGEAEFWVGLARVILDAPGRPATVHVVETARAYRDRLVLKLKDIEGPSAAARLRGSLAQASAEDAREAARGRFHPVLLIGLRALGDGGRVLGRVTAVMPTAGTGLLVIEPESGSQGRGHEILLPAVPEFVGAVDEPAGTVTVHPPPGLLELGDPEDSAE